MCTVFVAEGFGCTVCGILEVWWLWLRGLGVRCVGLRVPKLVEAHDAVEGLSPLKHDDAREHLDLQLVDKEGRLGKGGSS